MLKNPKSSAFLILSSSNLDSKEITNILNIQPDFYNTVEENGTPKTIWQLNSNLSPDDVRAILMGTAQNHLSWSIRASGLSEEVSRIFLFSHEPLLFSPPRSPDPYPRTNF